LTYKFPALTALRKIKGANTIFLNAHKIKAVTSSEDFCGR